LSCDSCGVVGGLIRGRTYRCSTSGRMLQISDNGVDLLPLPSRIGQSQHHPLPLP
jgi:hypothetical protein